MESQVMKQSLINLLLRKENVIFQQHYLFRMLVTWSIFYTFVCVTFYYFLLFFKNIYLYYEVKGYNQNKFLSFRSSFNDSKNDKKLMKENILEYWNCSCFDKKNKYWYLTIGATFLTNFLILFINFLRTFLEHLLHFCFSRKEKKNNISVWNFVIFSR